MIIFSLHMYDEQHLRAVMMVFHKIFGIVGGALNGAKGEHACHSDTFSAARHPAASSLVSSPVMQKCCLYQKRPGPWCWKVPCDGTRQIDVSAGCPAGLVTGHRRTSAASRTVVTSAGVKALKRSASRVCPCHVRVPWLHGV